MTTVLLNQAFERISEMISIRRPFEKKDIEEMVKNFSIEEIWIISGKLAFLKAEKKEKYEGNISDIKDHTAYAFGRGGSMSGFYDEDASLQFIGFQEKAQKIDKAIDFLRQISKDLF